MRIKFTHYIIEKLYEIDQIKHHLMPTRHVVAFSNPAHFTIFALTWPTFLKDTNRYMWQLDRYVVIE
jgi:hypothetical protein